MGCLLRTYLLLMGLMLIFFNGLPVYAAPFRQDDPAAQCAEGVQLFREGNAAEALPLLEAGFANREQATFANLYDLEMCALALGRLRNRSGNFSGALEAFQVALDLSRSEGNRAFEGTILSNIGLVYSDQGRYAEALEVYQQALSIIREISNRAEEGAILSNIGLVYSDQGRYAEALEMYQQALVITREVGSQAGEGTTLNNIGDIYDRLGQYEAALDYYRQSLIISQEIGDRTGEGTTLNNIGVIYDRLGQYEAALDYHQQSLSILQEIGDQAGEGTTLNNIGSMYRSLGQYDQALNYYRQSLGIRQEIGDRAGEGITLNNIGLIYTHWGQYEAALDYFQQSLIISQEIGDRTGEGTTLNNIGLIYRSLGQYDQAFNYYWQSLNIRQEIGTRAGEGATLNNIGGVYDSLGQHEQALDYYQRSLNIRQEIGDRAGEGQSLNNIGGVYDSLGQHEQALDYYQRSLSTRQEIGDRAGEGESLNNIGSIYRRLGQNETALDFFWQSLSIQREIGNRVGEGATLTNIGVVYNDLRKYKLALDYLQQALAIHQEIGDQVEEGIILAHTGFAYEQLGDADQAITFYQQAIDAFEPIQRSLGVEELKASFASKHLDTYEQLINLLWAEGHFEEAFNYAERARGWAFLDQLVGGAVNFRAGANRKLMVREQELKAEIAIQRAQLVTLLNRPGEDRDAEAISTTQVELAALEKDYANLLIQLQILSPKVAALVSVDVASLANIQALLDVDTTLIEYFVTKESILVFVITRDTFEPVALEVSREDLTKIITQFRDFAVLNDPHPISLQQLHVWLIASLKPYLTNPVIGFIPHDILYHIPFAALTNGERYLIDDYALFVLPSANALPFLQERRKPDTGTLLAVGNPTTATRLPNLPFAQQEVERIADMYGTQALIGPNATETAVWSQASEASILHLATYAVHNQANPLFNALHLTGDSQNDGRLEVYEIYNLDLEKTTLVTLSMDESAIDKSNRIDSIFGLSRPFFYAGTPSVMGSLWNVDDEATNLLMTEFYQHLKRGENKAEALRQAQMTVRNDFAHPYYWAGFTLMGDYQNITFTSPLSQFIQMLSLFFSIAIILVVAYLYFFIARPNRISILMAFQLLFYPRQLALAAGGGYLEGNWENWRDRIWRELLKKGSVADNTLNNVPVPFRNYALEQFYREHPDLDLVYDKTGQIVKHHQEALIQPLNHTWEEAQQALRQGDEVVSHIDKLAEQFSKLVNLSIETPAANTVGTLQYFVMSTTPAFQKSKLLKSLPLIFLTRLELNELDLDNIRGIFRRFQDTPRRIALLILFLDPDQVDTAKHQIDERLRQVYACDVIALTREDVLQITFQKDRYRAVRQTILRNVDLTTISPFTMTGPVSVDTFFGREAELREIVERVDRNTFAVIGGRRVGKTSLLRRLHHIRLPAVGFRTLYYDCSATPTYNAFLAASIRDWQPDPPSDAPVTFVDLFQSPLGDKPLILLLDEADKLVSVDETKGWQLFNMLRAMANSGQARIVLSGERTLRNALRDSTSPLFNFANEMILGPLNFRAVEELVTQPMRQLEIELVDEEVIVRHIYDLTSGHPNVVQRLCHRLIERLNEQGEHRLTPSDVQAVLRHPDFQRDDFLSTYWEAATTLEKIISLLMADDKNIRTLQAVRQVLSDRCNLQPGSREIDNTLQLLVDLRSILRRTSTGYDFAVEAFPRVVAGTITSDDMLEILVEEYQEARE